jgi:hypothetical protein
MCCLPKSGELMARPRLNQSAETTQTAFKIPQTDLIAINKSAKRAKQTQSQWIRLAIAEKLEREQNG